MTNDDEFRYEEYKRSRPQRKRRGYFFAGFIGAIIGALIIVLLLPRLSQLGVLSMLQGSTSGTNFSGITQGVSVDVDTDVTKAVDIAADAVVGITNLQESGFGLMPASQRLAQDQVLSTEKVVIQLIL